MSRHVHALYDVSRCGWFVIFRYDVQYVSKVKPTAMLNVLHHDCSRVANSFVNVQDIQDFQDLSKLVERCQYVRDC